MGDSPEVRTPRRMKAVLQIRDLCRQASDELANFDDNDAEEREGRGEEEGEGEEGHRY